MADAEIAQLKAIVNKLPQTADGQRVVPGCDRVWRMVKGKPTPSTRWKGWGAYWEEEREEDEYVPIYDPLRCYSSKEALLNAPKTKNGTITHPGDYLKYIGNKGVYRLRCLMKPNSDEVDPVDGNPIKVADCERPWVDSDYSDYSD